MLVILANGGNSGLPEQDRTQRMTFVGCKVVNSLNNGWSGYTKLVSMLMMMALVILEMLNLILLCN